VRTGVFPGHRRASGAKLCVLSDLVPSGAGKPCHQWRTQHGWSETIAVRPRWNTQLGGPFQARNSCWRPGPKGSATRRCARGPPAAGRPGVDHTHPARLRPGLDTMASPPPGSRPTRTLPTARTTSAAGLLSAAFAFRIDHFEPCCSPLGGKRLYFVARRPFPRCNSAPRTRAAAQRRCRVRPRPASQPAERASSWVGSPARATACVVTSRRRP
jgi:hypothetical protein